MQKLVSALEAQLQQAKEDVSHQQSQAAGLAGSVGAQLEEIRACLAQERHQLAQTQVPACPVEAWYFWCQQL